MKLHSSTNTKMHLRQTSRLEMKVENWIADGLEFGVYGPELAIDPAVIRSCPTTDLYVVHCWLISPNNLNLLSWLWFVIILCD